MPEDVQDFIDNHLASWLSCVVHLLHALYDMFHLSKGFLGILRDIKGFLGTIVLRDPRR